MIQIRRVMLESKLKEPRICKQKNQMKSQATLQKWSYIKR